MVHLWHPRKRAGREGTSTPPGIGATGDIAVVVEENELTQELVRLACLMAKHTRRSIRLLHVIEVPRTLPLSTIPSVASELAAQVLAQALAIAEEAGCAARTEVVQARDAAAAIVEEVRDQPCALLLIGLVPSRKAKDLLGKTIPYILGRAPCRVWLIQETPTRSFR